MHGMEHGGSTTPGDITTMGGLRKHMPHDAACTFLMSCLAIAGIFPFAGLLLEGRDPRRRVDVGAAHRRAGRVVRQDPVGRPARRRARHRVLHVAPVLPRVRAASERSEAAKHAHESPSSMAVPLVVLALFATVAGFIGLPHLEHTHLPAFTHALARWLEPSVVATWYDPQRRRSSRSRPRRDTTTLRADGRRADDRRARHRRRVGVLRPRPVADGRRARRGPLARALRGLEAQAVVRRDLRRDDRAAVPRGRARPVRDRRSLHHRHGRGQRHPR